MERVRSKLRRPSPSMAVAGAALVVALAGTAIAGPLASNSALSKKEQKKVKKIANKQIKAQAPGLTVGNSNALAKVSLVNLVPAAQVSDGNCDPNTGGGVFDDCESVSITTARTADIHVSVTGVWFDANAEPVEGQCRLERNGTDISSDASWGVSAALDVTANATAEQPLAITDLDANMPAGTYTYNLACNEVTADFSMEDVLVTVVAVGS